MYEKSLLVDDDAKNKLCKLHNGIRQWPESRVNTKSFPRRCGDESIGGELMKERRRFSPQVRG